MSALGHDWQFQSKYCFNYRIRPCNQDSNVTYTAGGNPCGANGTFSECAFLCPNQYCPEDDSQLKVACKPGRPCPPGCTCKPYYLKKSYDDETCVLASDCSK